MPFLPPNQQCQSTDRLSGKFAQQLGKLLIAIRHPYDRHMACQTLHNNNNNNNVVVLIVMGQMFCTEGFIYCMTRVSF